MIHFFRRQAPRDQTNRLRRLVKKTAERPQPEGPAMIVVAGSKGGVGATTIAWRLAESLTRRGVRSAAIDANLRQADLAQLSRLSPADQRTGDIVDVMTGKAAAAKVLQPTAGGPLVLPGAWAPAAHPEATHEGMARLLGELMSLGDHADALVIDAGSGLTPWSEPLWRAAGRVLLVATDDRLSLLDAYAAIKLARAGRSPDPPPGVGLFVNRCGGESRARRVHQQINQTCERFLGEGAPLSGWAPEQRALTDTAGDGSSPHVDLLAKKLIAKLNLEASPEQKMAAA